MEVVELANLEYELGVLRGVIAGWWCHKAPQNAVV